MSVNAADEYSALRAEMLARFEKIFETVKLGVPGLIAVLAYQQAKPATISSVWLLNLAELLLVAIGLVCLNEFRHIYRLGTYLALFCEGGGQPGWHRMSRSLEQLFAQDNLWVSCDDKKLRERATRRPPVGQKWGEDSTFIACIILFLFLVAWASAISVGLAIDRSSPKILGLAVALLLAVFVIILIIALTNGIRRYKTDTKKIWEKHRAAWGKEVQDPYKDRS